MEFEFRGSENYPECINQEACHSNVKRNKSKFNFEWTRTLINKMDWMLNKPLSLI